MNPEQVVEATVQRFTLNPGEIVVLTFPGAITYEQAANIRDYWNRRFPDNRCVVLSDGGHVSGVLSGEHEVAS